MVARTALKETAREASTPAVRPSRGRAPFDEMERMLDLMFEGFQPRRWAWPFARAELSAFNGRIPHVDVIDRENEVLVKAELPGVEKKDLDVSMSDNSVTIKASTYQEQKQKKEDGNYCRSEIAQGDFMRTVALPAEVDEAQCKATFNNGVLELVMPKREPAKLHRITVQ